MSLLRDTQLICKQYNISPTRSKGQNFLIDEYVYDQIIEASNLNEVSVALEVGPGLGILTRLLAKNLKQVIAVELDKTIYDYLLTIKELENIDNIKLLNENILDTNVENLITENYKIVANLPYNITSVFLRKFLTRKHKPKEMILMLQKEVAERIIAKPGQMSLLALSVQFYADAKIIMSVPKESFWPAPKVDSAVIKITTVKDKFKIEEKELFRLAKIGFSAKRKKLANNLANGLHLKPAEIVSIFEKIGLTSNSRAQELSLENWIEIAKVLK
jgi:16S rRNA (adenine1518-N6/adenine1519-N6)-dimethyltransferase